MTKLLTSAQMRAIERAAIGSGTVSGLELMERAGRGVVAAVFDQWPDLAAAPHRAQVLCGPGNNGGDGFVVARLLKEWGWEVDLFLFGAVERLPPDARGNCNRWSEMGKIRPVTDIPDGSLGGHLEGTAPAPDLFLDAVFGTGLTRPLPEVIATIARQVSCSGGHRTKRVAVDVPSGLCADSGQVIGTDPGAVFVSDLTVTFHCAKLGHHLNRGPGVCGTLVTKGIGL